MTGLQKIRAWILAGSVTALLVGGCAYLVWEIRQSTDPDEVVLFDPAHPDAYKANNPYYRTYRARWERVPLAELPWRNLEIGSEPASVPLAFLPSLRPRRDWNNPVPTTVSLAICPWGRDLEPPHPAEVTMARIPPAYRAAIKGNNNRKQK